MKLMVTARTRLTVVLMIIILVSVTRILIDLSVAGIPNEVKEVLHRYKVVDAVLAVIVGVIVVQLTASTALIYLKPFGKAAYLIRNVILIVGYIILAFIVGGILGLSSESVLASATFSGLIIGLALQPVLSNFFAGLIILTTGFLRPGQEIRLAGIPLTFLPFPAYKFFSRDYVVPSIRGTVVEIGFMYTKILDVDGNLIKVSNNMLLNSSIVLEESEGEKRIQIRYEFPVTCNPDEVLSELHTVLRKILDEYKLYIEEQSDKQNYIVIITALVPPKVSTRAYRSTILKEIIKIHRRFLLENKCGI